MVGSFPFEKDLEGGEDTVVQPSARLADSAPLTPSPPTNPEITPARVASVIPGFFPGDLGIEPLEIDDDRASGRLVCDARHLHPGGFVHGGVWVSFADTVAAWATMRSLPSGAALT